MSRENNGKGKYSGRWRSGISFKGKSYNLGSYEDPLEAAQVYDAWAIHFHGTGARTNRLLSEEEKENIVKNGVPDKYVKTNRIVENPYPEGISITRFGTFRFRRLRDGKEISKTVKTLEEAIKIKIEWEAKWKEEDEEKERQRRQNITRNAQGIAVVMVKNKEEWIECLVDDIYWGELTQYSWACDQGKYVTARLPWTNQTRMHRIIYLGAAGEIPKDMTIDHINGNRFDNRLCNLRLADKSLQSHNRAKYTNNLTRFNGVHFTGFRYATVIGYRRVAHYDSEEEAALRANEEFIKIYGVNARLNVVPNTRTTKENRLPLSMITREYIESITSIIEMKHLIRVLELNEGAKGDINLEKTKCKHLRRIQSDLLANKYAHIINMRF